MTKLSIEQAKKIMLENLQQIEESIKLLKEEVENTEDLNSLQFSVKISSKFNVSKMENINKCLEEYKNN